MAKGTKTGGRPFLPGNKGGGRPRLPEELKAIIPLNSETISRVIGRFANMTRDEIKAFLQDPKTPMLYVAIGTILVKAAATADHSRFEFLLRRSVGAVKEETETSNNVIVSLAYDPTKKLTQGD